MTDFLKVMDNWDGFRAARSPKVNEGAMARTINLLLNKDGLSKRMHEARLEEAISTSDFPYLFGQVIDRQLLASYRAPDDPLYRWQDYVKISTVPDFNTVRREKVSGKDPLLPEVPEKGEYKPFKPTNCRYTYNVKKYGRQFDISWEAIMNDSLGAFNDIPQEMANAAKDTEAYIATSQFAASTGDGNASLYGATITDCGQAITNLGVLPLTITNLETTLGLMKNQTSPEGKLLKIRPKFLVVPPALELTARAILTSTIKTWSPESIDVDGTVYSTPYPTTNVLPQTGLQLRVNEWLPYIDTTHGSTAWYLFADPAMGAAVEVGYLRGHETPEVVMKASNKVAVGGGAMSSPFSGDFETDNIMYRVRDVIGGTPMDPRFTYLQSGA
jgi:hypothetical protein